MVWNSITFAKSHNLITAEKPSYSYSHHTQEDRIILRKYIRDGKRGALLEFCRQYSMIQFLQSQKTMKGIQDDKSQMVSTFVWWHLYLGRSTREASECWPCSISWSQTWLHKYALCKTSSFVYAVFVYFIACMLYWNKRFIQKIERFSSVFFHLHKDNN